MIASRRLSRPAITLSALAAIGCMTHARSQDSLFVPSSLVIGRGAGEVVLADVNCDRHLDIVTQHLLERLVAVQIGDGNGHFAPLATGTMTLAFEPGAMAVEDVSMDGILDLIIASKNTRGEYVHVFLGDGSGVFGAAAGSPYTVSTPFAGYKPALRIVDVNQDGHPDIVIANGRRNSVEIFLGAPSGIFSAGPVIKLESGHDYYSFAIGDVDGDQHLDLVTVSSGAAGRAGRIEVKRGNGLAGFGDAAVSAPPVPADPRLAVLADVDDDQDVDIVLSHADKRQLSVLLNGGWGGFTPAPSSPYAIGAEAFGVVVADANRDGSVDLFAATVNSVTVLLGGGHTFAMAQGSPFRTGPGVYNLAVGDLNEDGSVDVLASSFEGDTATVLLNHGVGAPSSAE